MSPSLIIQVLAPFVTDPPCLEEVENLDDALSSENLDLLILWLSNFLTGSLAIHLSVLCSSLSFNAFYKKRWSPLIEQEMDSATLSESLLLGLGLELVGNPDSWRNEMYGLIQYRD